MNFKLTLPSLLLLLLCTICAAGQQPIKENSSESSAGKSDPILIRIRQVNAPATTTPDPVASLRAAKFIYVKSFSILVGASVVEEKLQRRKEFAQLGLVVTRDVNEADLILELEHDVLTKYVYTAIDVRTNIVVASGKLSSLGGTVAGKVAKRFLKQVEQARR